MAEMDSWMDVNQGDSVILEVKPIEDEEKEREERIGVRRARIAAKMAEEIDVGGETESIASSVELLTGHRDKPQVGPAKPNTPGNRLMSSAMAVYPKKPGAGAFPGTASTRPPSTGTTASSSNVGKDQLEIQLEQCRKQLEQLLLDGETLVTNVKVAAEYRERARQDTMKQTKKARLAKLRAEAEECEQAYKTIESQWFTSAVKVLPLELYEIIQEQQLSCDKLLEKKQDLIDDLQSEMDSNDVEYENDLEKYQGDMMLMGDRIDDHVDTLRTSFMEELQLVENFTTLDREVMLEQNQKEWMDLLEQFEALDENSTANRQKGALDRFDKLGDLYAETREEANRIKQALEDDFRALQLELEHIKLATIINLEKLEYNLEVLRRREIENLAMKNSMKRYLLKLQDKFNSKVQDYKNLIYAAKRENEQIIREILRLEEINGDARNKILHLLATDYRTYMDLWNFNEEEATVKLKKLHSSEKLIYETQFGLKMTDLNFAVFEDRPSEVVDFLVKEERKRKKRQAFLAKQNCGALNVANPSKKKGGHGHGHGGGGKHFEEKHQRILSSQEDIFEGDGPGTGRSTDDLLDDDEDITGDDNEQGDEDNNPGDYDDLDNLDADSDALYDVDEDGHRHFGKSGGDASKHKDHHPPGGRPSLLIEQTDSNEFLPNEMKPDPQVQRKLMKHIALVICDQTGFIIEEKLRKILAPMIKTEKTLVHIDAVLQALGVTSIPEMQLMGRYLLRRSHVMDGVMKKAATARTEASSMNVSGQEPPASPHLDLPKYDRIIEHMLGKDDLADIDLKAEEEAAMLARSVEEEEVEEAEEEEEDDTEGDDEEYDEDAEDEDFDDSINLDDYVIKESIASIASIDENDIPSLAASKLTELVERTERRSMMIAKLSTVVDEDSADGVGEFTEEEALEGEEPMKPKTRHSIRKRSDVVADADAKLAEAELLEKAKAEADEEEKFSEVTSARTDIATIATFKIKKAEKVDGEHEADAEAEKKPSLKEVPSTVDLDSLELCIDESTASDTRKPIADATTMKSLLDGGGGGDSAVESSETVSIQSLPTTPILNEEFLYIQPNDVLRALAEFCKDFNARIKVELPSMDELIDAKLERLKFPNKEDVIEFWDRFLLLLDPKHVDWNAVLYCFGQFNKLLKLRNQYVDDTNSLFQENMELSYLLKKHLQGGGRGQCLTKIQKEDVPYC